MTESVLTQRDSIRKLILQVKELAKSLQKLQNHQCLSKEIRRKPGPYRERAGELLEETHRQNIKSLWMSRDTGCCWVEAFAPSDLHTPYLLWVCSTISAARHTSSSPPLASLVPAN